MTWEVATEQEAEGRLDHRVARARWVAEEILPHDRQMRNWFLKRGVPFDDLDDAMQEAYYRLAVMEDVRHISNPGAYCFVIVRNFITQRLKQKQVVSLDAIMELEVLSGQDIPGVEEQVGARLSVEKVMAIIGGLPDRCRRIVELRKIENWSQKDIAQHFGMTEKAVEKQIWLGVRAVREAWSKAESKSETRLRQLGRQSGTT